MEGDVMDKLEEMASVCEFDPVTGDIPATKVEITVSCRYEAQSQYINSLKLNHFDVDYIISVVWLNILFFRFRK